MNIERKRRRRVLMKDLRKTLCVRTRDIYPDVRTEGIVVFSGPTPEDCWARIKIALTVIRRIVSFKFVVSENSIENDSLELGPKLFLNGTPAQLSVMLKMVLDTKMPAKRIELIDCGEKGNTKTQFEVINNNPLFADTKRLSFVTAGYHVPRIIHTTRKNLRSDIEFDIIGVFCDRGQSYDVYMTIQGRSEED